MENDVKMKSQCIAFLNENIDLTFSLTEMLRWTFFVLLFDNNRQNTTNLIKNLYFCVKRILKKRPKRMLKIVLLVKEEIHRILSEEGRCRYECRVKPITN